MIITIVWSMWSDDEALAAEMRINGKKPVTNLATSFDFQWMIDDSDEAILERVFRETNMYGGPLWKLIEPRLPEDRTHTALSVGDYVLLEDRVYRCDSFGWSRHAALPPHVMAEWS